MDRVLGTLERRIHRLLARRGVLEADGEGSTADRWQDEAPVLAAVAAASVQGRRALGERAGAAVRRCGVSSESLAPAPTVRGPCHARGNGFDLHAAVVVPPRDRAQLERLCRYALRPPIAADGLHLTADGQVVVDLRRRWADGTTQLLFEPVELLERLAALTPRSHSADRIRGTTRTRRCPDTSCHTQRSDSAPPRRDREGCARGRCAPTVD